MRASLFFTDGADKRTILTKERPRLLTKAFSAQRLDRFSGEEEMLNRPFFRPKAEARDLKIILTGKHFKSLLIAWIGAGSR